MPTRHLRLHHELLLLALHDDKGTLAFGQMQHVGLAGALFAELLLDGKIRIVEEKRRRKVKEFVEVVDRQRVGEDVMDAALEKLGAASRRASPRDTVLRLSRLKDLRHQVGRELARKGVLRATEDEVLFFFKRRIYPTLDPAPERELVSRIRAVVDGGVGRDDHLDPRTVLLVALAHATSTLRAIYDRKAMKAMKPRVEALAARAGAGADAAAEAIKAAQAAAVAATTAAITAATAASAAG